jgi:hypothetical protein
MKLFLKNNEFIMSTHNHIQKTVFFLCIIVALSSCKKNDDKDFLLQNEWKIKSISIDKETLKPSSKTFRGEAYILKFINDTNFVMNTSVNYAGGRYQIVSEGYIRINYQEWTEVGNTIDEQRYFDEQLLNILNNVNSYYYKGNKLFLFAEKNREIVFSKK